ncbi:MAG: hypothetical protein ACKVX9_08420 [Blastocatellia bacterium]
MKNLKTLNIVTEVLGMPVLDPDTARLHGRVTEAIVHPTAGALLGLLLETPGGAERAVLSEDCFIFGDVAAVLTPGCLVTETARLADKLSAGVAVNRELLGAEVVTEAGEKLGHLTEAHIYEERLQVFYHIAQSRLQEFLGGGFFISGRLPLRWLREDAQLIVPAQQERFTREDGVPRDRSDPDPVAQSGANPGQYPSSAEMHGMNDRM